MEQDRFRAVYEGWRDRIRKAVSVPEQQAPKSSTDPAPKSPTDPAPGGPEDGPWALIGIKRRGAVLARRLWKDLSAPGRALLHGEVDISLYRDDYHLQRASPEVLGTEISFGVEGTRILLVDDVLYTGRTVRAAMDLILDFGRPRGILLAVFADRGHRELPIAANFVGTEIPTERADEVYVRLSELGEEDGVELITGGRSTGR
jgi:pyrimidine operon attenuation protein/uracil phosphoribosyltransferase